MKLLTLHVLMLQLRCLFVLLLQWGFKVLIVTILNGISRFFFFVEHLFNNLLNFHCSVVVIRYLVMILKKNCLCGLVVKVTDFKSLNLTQMKGRGFEPHYWLIKWLSMWESLLFFFTEDWSLVLVFSGNNCQVNCPNVNNFYNKGI